MGPWDDDWLTQKTMENVGGYGELDASGGYGKWAIYGGTMGDQVAVPIESVDFGARF